jgi:hypothetical protein
MIIYKIKEAGKIKKKCKNKTIKIAHRKKVQDQDLNHKQYKIFKDILKSCKDINKKKKILSQIQ